LDTTTHAHDDGVQMTFRENTSNKLAQFNKSVNPDGTTKRVF